MAQQVKVPYFTVNKFGQLTVAGETVVSIPDGTTSWASITGKPVTFPPSTHTHVLSELEGVYELNDTGAGSTIISNAATSKLKKLRVAGSLTATSDYDSVTLTASGGGGDGGVATVVFSSEETYSTVDVAYPACTGTNTILVSLAESEDAAIQGLTVGVLSQTVGVGFSLWVNAPDGATGSFAINYLIS